MWWLLLIIIVIVAAFAVPKFGKFLLGTILVIAVVGGVAIYEVQRRREVETEAAKTRILRSQLELDSLELQPGYFLGSYTLIGRVRNRSSEYTLDNFRLKLIMRDCLSPDDCEVVGEKEQSIYTTVPPGQARDIDDIVSFSDLGEPRGTLQWDHEVIEISGK